MTAPEFRITQAQVNSFTKYLNDIPNPVTDFIVREGLEKMLRALPVIKSEPELTGEGQWWCPLCKESPIPQRVTFEENHDTCGHPVEWIEFVKQAPKPSQGMVTVEAELRWLALEIERSQSLYEGSKPEFQRHIDKALAAILPNVSGRKCLLCGSSDYPHMCGGSGGSGGMGRNPDHTGTAR
jgi:hypothetical protein